jgi:hypothetical protein
VKGTAPRHVFGNTSRSRPTVHGAHGCLERTWDPVAPRPGRPGSRTVCKALTGSWRYSRAGPPPREPVDHPAITPGQGRRRADVGYEPQVRRRHTVRDGGSTNTAPPVPSRPPVHLCASTSGPSCLRRTTSSAHVKGGAVMPRQPSRTNTSLFRCQGSGCAERGVGAGTTCWSPEGSLSRCGDYRLPGGRLKDALRAPLRGRAAPGS